MPELDRIYDVVVAGGGPAGGATALLLAREGMSTLLVDAAPDTSQKVGETLLPSAGRLLRELGVWDAFARDGHVSSHGIVSVWNSPRPQVNDFFASPFGQGWQLDRSRFDRMLREESRQAGAVVALGSRITSCERHATDGWRLSLSDHGESYGICARYLVDATGRTGAGALRGLSPRALTDNLIGVVSRFHDDRPHAYTLVEAVQDGWFYSTSVPNRTLVVVYLTDADIYAERKKSQAEPFRAPLKGAALTRARVEGLKPAGAVRPVSAATSRRERVAGPGWIAVGDAALSLDPLSSLGIFKALDSAHVACESIWRGLHGRPWIRQYQGWCNDVWQSCLNNRAMHYGNQPRWAESPFWRRRQPARHSHFSM